MGRCNYCSNQFQIRRVNIINGNAGKVVACITYIANTTSGLGGVDVYVHPIDVNIFTASEQEKENWFTSWYMDLPTECVC